MIKNGFSSRRDGEGVIIDIASTPAISGHVVFAPCSIARSGVIAITKHSALENGDESIRAYTLALCNILTEGSFSSMTQMETKGRRWRIR